MIPEDAAQPLATAAHRREKHGRRSPHSRRLRVSKHVGPRGGGRRARLDPLRPPVQEQQGRNQRRQVKVGKKRQLATKQGEEVGRDNRLRTNSRGEGSATGRCDAQEDRVS